MARPLRIEYPEAFYHVMNRGGQLRRNIFIAVDISPARRYSSRQRKSVLNFL
jgi:hypothetical protein